MYNREVESQSSIVLTDHIQIFKSTQAIVHNLQQPCSLVYVLLLFLIFKHGLQAVVPFGVIKTFIITIYQFFVHYIVRLLHFYPMSLPNFDYFDQY